jgi:hypothetical protein
MAAFAEAVSRGWGMRSDWAVQVWAPSMVGDEPFTEWLARYARQSVSRGAILPLLSAFYAYDLADVFPTVRVPTLVLHRRDDGLVPVSNGRHIASQIPDARFVELEGADHLPFVGDAEAVLAEVQDFLVGSRTPIPRQRRLLTLLFTDTAESVPKAVDLGDDAWRELLAAHDRDVRTHLTRFGGEEVKQLGNGVLAAFDGPARAIRCALGIVEVSEPKGLSVRVGVHTGECAVGEGDVRGIAVQVGARIVELAAPGRSWSRARSPTSSPARASVSVRAATSSWPACREPLGSSRSCATAPAPTPSAARRSSRPISSAATASTGRLATGAWWSRCATPRACATSGASSPNPAASSTPWI